MLLVYDRVFSAMGVPACLWRRTGEIYKGNRQFSELVGIDGMMLRDVSMFALPSLYAHLRTGSTVYIRTDGRGVCR
jgi:hypothetical protein